MPGSGREGFTLIEVMVVCGVLVVGAMGLLASQGSLMNAQTQNKETALALSVARGVIEEVRETPYDQITPHNFEASFNTDLDRNELNTLLGEPAVGTLQVDGPDAGDVKTITVQVQWRGHGNKTRSVRLVTEVSNHL